MTNSWGIVNRDEIHHFTQELNKHQRGELPEEDFTAQRLQFGIYGQRQESQYMVRIKIPGGVLYREQLDCIGQLLEKYSSAAFANITTRQDIQLHFVDLKNIPKVLLRLADVGLTTREACGNTVRNITACPMAGVCPQEHLDIRPLLNKTTSYFLRHPLTQHLPRKFKMSFSGCESDCAMGLMHDLAVVAVKKDGNIGFKVLVGGGLGHKPREAFVLEDFVPEKRVIPIIESIITLHNRYSDRTKRAKSRIKFLVDKFGQAKFKEKYQQILLTTENRIEKSENSEFSIHRHPMRWCNIDFKSRTEKQESKSAFNIKLPLGDVTPQIIKQISDTMIELDLNELRTTQSQNLLMIGVDQKYHAYLEHKIMNQDTLKYPKSRNIVACPGSWTCRLGITASRDMAIAAEKEIKELNVNISGCHNSCAQPQVSDIGLHGEGRRKFGKLLPYYRLYFGGDGSVNGGFARKGPEIPASRVLAAIRRVERNYQFERDGDQEFRHWVKSKNSDYFNVLLSDYMSVTVDDIPALNRDQGEQQDFKVLQLGGGECAGISEETVSAFLSEAKYEKGYRDIFVRQSDWLAVLECSENMMLQIARSLLFVKGEKSLTSHIQILEALPRYYAGNQVVASYGRLFAVIESFKKSCDKSDIERLVEDLNTFYEEALQLIDRLQLISSSQQKAEVLDLTQDASPLQFLKAKRAINAIDKGGSMKIKLRRESDANLVSKGLESTGFKLLELIDDIELNSITLHMLKPFDYSNSDVDLKEESHIA